MNPDPLAGLRDYHLPEAAPWWPPAPGWWLLAGLLFLSGLIVAVAVTRRRRRQAAARQALQELAALEAQADGSAFARGLSKLLRRYALTAFPGEATAALTGDDWLAFLEAHGGGQRFREGTGRQLGEAPYRRAGEVATAELAALARAWIWHNREVRR